MIELKGVVGDAFIYGEPIPSHSCDVLHAVWCRHGAPRAVIVKRLQHWYLDSDELVEVMAERARP